VVRQSGGVGVGVVLTRLQDGSRRASVLVGSTVTKKEAIGMSVGFVGKRRKEAKKKWKSSSEWHSVRKDAVRVIN
jgi:hypothetical protein